MDQPGTSSPLNLTGEWHGLYSYPVAMPSVSFVATLSDQGGWFDGTTEEIGSVGDAAGRTLTASLQGRRSGCSITMLKIYHRASVHYDSVRYAGDLNEDGSEIHGTWRVAGNWSGTFLMIRQRAVATVLSREAEERT
ncbi:MAG: hypothetical protein HC861_05080 [Rhodospirillaceae bacterium]|nr:hypothetical protein [Rhodospirillaceae bacterium]